LLGLSCFPTDHDFYVGFLGMHGNYGPNVLTNEADVIIAIGMRFDDRVTGNLASYAKQAKIIHIDIDPAEINKNVPAEVGLVGDAKQVLEQLLPYIQSPTPEHNRENWHKKFQDCHKTEFEQIIQGEIHANGDEIKMAEVVHLLAEKTHGEAVIVTDVGQHQMVTARYYQFKKNSMHITSGGLGTMGFALPAAIGAKLGAYDKQVIAIIGDGGFQMNIQELGVIDQEGVPLKIIILNNQHLGMVRQWQEMFFAKRYSFVELKNPNFIKIAEGYSIPAVRIEKHADLNQALDDMLAATTPYLLEIVVEKQEKIFPMIVSGSGVSEIRLS
ncbi:MAG: thiamine pyrophosphate-binding protein, partial [Gammaproteobacteria bacterium]